MIKLAYIKQSPVFFFGFLFIIIIGSILVLVEGNPSSFILLNSYHSFWLDTFFIKYTYLGHGFFAIFLAVFYFFWLKSKQTGVVLLYAFLLSGLITQTLKHIIYSPRPKLFFGNSEQSYFINGIEFAYNNSFPSGHTATAFAVATVLAITDKNKKFHLLILLAALFIGFSRIYLGQHFLTDVLAGMLTGIFSGIVCVYIARKYDWTESRNKQLVASREQSSLPS